MRRFIKYLLPALLLALCLSLAACGSGGDTDTDTDAAPDSFEGMVKDSDRMVSLSDYGGMWAGDDGSTMLVEAGGDGDEVRFALYDTGDEVTASGFIQSFRTTAVIIFTTSTTALPTAASSTRPARWMW